MDIRVFLAHAVKLEREAEEAYRELARLMKDRANVDAAAFFGEMAGFCRLHGEAAMTHAGFGAMADIPDGIVSWSGGASEIPDTGAAVNALDLDGAELLALAAERRGADFYAEVARTTTDPQTRILAAEFAAEERGHVLALERFLGLKSY